MHVKVFVKSFYPVTQSQPEEEGDKPVIKGRDRWKALSGVLHSNPASFSQMSKVAAKQHQQQQQQQLQQEPPPATAPEDSAIRKVAKMASVVAAMRGNNNFRRLSYVRIQYR